MAFSGRIYWHEYNQVIRYWDSATRTIEQLVCTNPGIPTELADLNYFGNLTLLPDGRILTYFEQRFGPDSPWAGVFDANLTPDSGVAWFEEGVPSNYAYYAGIQIVPDEDRNMVWVPWFLLHDDGIHGTFVQGFDMAGTAIEQAQLFDNDWAIMSFGWNFSDTAGNGVLVGSKLYRTVQSHNWIDCYDLTTGEWTYIRAYLPHGLGTDYLSPVGVLNSGEVVYYRSDYANPAASSLCTLDGDPWLPIDNPSPGATPYVTVTDIGTPIADEGGAGRILVQNDHAYYPAGTWGSSRWVEQDLATGVATTLFEIPEMYLTFEGEVTTIDGDWYYDFGDASAILGATLAPGSFVIDGQLDTSRVRPYYT